MSDNDVPARRSRIIHDPLISYPVLDLVRNPSLVSTDDRRRLDLLFATVERTRQELDLLAVLSGLNAVQQTEVAAIVLDIDAERQLWRATVPRLRRLRYLAKRGPAHIRMLAKKLDRANSALVEIESYSRKLDSEIEEWIGPYIEAARRAVVMAQARLISPRETLDQYTSRMRGWYQEGIRHSPQADPMPSAVKRLVEYFRENASSTLDDAHVRVATIGRARWGWSYKIVRDSYGDAICPGVRKLIDRVEPRVRRAAHKH